jgi:hypothetical protein
MILRRRLHICQCNALWQCAIVALANKLARMAWAVLAKNEVYRPPLVEVAASI